jgi:phospholipase C
MHQGRAPAIRHRVVWVSLVLYAALGLAGPAGCREGQRPSAASAMDPRTIPIDHIIVIYQENRSFDNLFGLFPGADGLASAKQAPPQVDKTGIPYDRLPKPINTSQRSPGPDPRFPANLPNAPFLIDAFVPPSQKTGDLVHRFYQEQLQIDGGRMDKFVAWSDAAGLVMGYYDGSKLPTWQLAQRFTLLDHFFHSAFGGSFLNHFWLVCACTPAWPEAPAALRAELDRAGAMTKDGAVTPDGFVVNTAFATYQPHPANVPADHLVPPQTLPTIGDRLSAAGVSWAWYSGGWNDALAGRPHPLFQFHHQAFAYFRQFGDGTAAKARSLRDEKDFLADIAADRLPAVAFVKPLGPDTEHPGYADLETGERHVADLVRRIEQSPAWSRSLVIITFDENGGFWDHVAPPRGDRWGPGTRVPAILVSPYARKGAVDHRTYETTSILRLIEWRWGLAPLGERDARAANLIDALNFAQHQ